MESENYRPRSPDLNFHYQEAEELEAPLHPQHQQFRGSVSHSLPPYTPVTPIGTPADYFFGGGGGGSVTSPPQGQPQQQQPVWHEPQYQQVSEPQRSSSIDMPRNISVKAEVKSEGMDEEYAPTTVKKGRGRGAAKQAKEEVKDEDGGQNSASHPAQEIKTKFPTARIKRIMQADEDVGKVAQVTPILVCKFIDF
jgi:hypothetical protein